MARTSRSVAPAVSQSPQTFPCRGDRSERMSPPVHVTGDPSEKRFGFPWPGGRGTGVRPIRIRQTGNQSVWKRRKEGVVDMK